MATRELRRQAIRIGKAQPVAATAMDDGVFVRRFRDREGPYHLYDSRERAVIRAETGAHVFGALLDDRTRLVFLDDPACPEISALRITYPIGEWSSEPIELKVCSCGEGRCKGKLVITLHEAHAGPNWMLTFRG